MINKIESVGAVVLSLIIVFSVVTASATVETVQEQEPKYKLAPPPQDVIMSKVSSKDKLLYNATVGVTQGVDSNPLLDPTKKADNYTEENIDMHFKYPLFSSPAGKTSSKFGFDVTNVTYYRVTDVNIMDSIIDADIEQELPDNATLSAGYVLDLMWFPNDRDGTFTGNEINTKFQQWLTGWVYHKAAYRLLFKYFPSRKAYLGNLTKSARERFDIRNTFEYEIGVYVSDKTKIRVYDHYYLNNSNDQYFDYYDYLNNKIGVSVTQALIKNLYNLTTFYYQRRNYDSRKASDGDATEIDNLYVVSTSLLYDITKNLSIYINYSHAENHTNEPLEKYADSLYTFGAYCSF